MYMTISSGGNSGGDGGELPITATHYDILGLTEATDAEEIKRAYYRLVREFRPQDHPEEFQRFNDAMSILADPRRRGAYDQSRRNGPRIQILVDQAATAQDTDPQKAITLLKNAIAIAPDVPRPRVLLATVLMRINEYAAAEKQYRWLVADNPNDDMLRSKLARSLLRQGKQDEAEEELEAALRINARYHDALMVLARLREDQGRNAEAAELMERAIANDGKENYADAEALLRLLVLYLLTSNDEESERASERLMAVLAANEGERAAKVIRRLLLRANELFYAEKYIAARRLLEFAIPTAAADEELAEQVQALIRAIVLKEEARHLQADTLVQGALKMYLELRYLEKTPDAARQQTDVILGNLQREISNDPRGICTLIEYLRREYRAISAEQDRLFTELYTRGMKRIELNADIAAKNSMSMPETGMPSATPVTTEKKGFFPWRRGGGK